MVKNPRSNETAVDMRLLSTADQLELKSPPVMPRQPATNATQLLPLLPAYRTALRNHFKGVTSKLLKLTPTKYIVLYLATYNQKCPINCDKGPCTPETYQQHLAKEHPSAILLQCPTAGCGSSFYGVHQLFHHLLKAHDPRNNLLTKFIYTNFRLCPYGCSADNRHPTIIPGNQNASLDVPLLGHHPTSRIPYNCGPAQLDALKLLHHLWDAFPGSSAPIPICGESLCRYQKHHDDKGPAPFSINSNVHNDRCPPSRL